MPARKFDLHRLWWRLPAADPVPDRTAVWQSV